MPKAIQLSRREEYHSLRLFTVPEPAPKPDEVLIQVTAAALNHRDLFIRQNLYADISFDAVQLADGCGVVLPHPNTAAAASSPTAVFTPGQRVLINPGAGWADDPIGPEGHFTVIGGVKSTALGTLQERVAVPPLDVAPAPAHLADTEAAALPLAGLTAWRALVTKSGNALPGRNILVTGIGGGVALMLLAFGVECGCRVFVTSSSHEKLARAEKVGAAGGVLYTDESGWPKTLKGLLPKERPFLDAVIDGSGRDIIDKTWKLLKSGGIVVCYGMTRLGLASFPMPAVLKNIELKGSTMGSRKEFQEMVAFAAEKKIRPVVDRVVEGIDNLEEIEDLYESMKKGSQFGKLMVRISVTSDIQAESKL